MKEIDSDRLMVLERLIYSYTLLVTSGVNSEFWNFHHLQRIAVLQNEIDIILKLRVDI